MSGEVEQVAEWAASCGLRATSDASTVLDLLHTLTPQLNKLHAAATRADASATQLASIQRVCEAGWHRGEPCRMCQRVGKHADTCYVRAGTGYDLLCEHEATVRENDELRAALAVRLPVNGKHILAGQQHKGLRQRARERFTKGDQ